MPFVAVHVLTLNESIGLWIKCVKNLTFVPRRKIRMRTTSESVNCFQSMYVEKHQLHWGQWLFNLSENTASLCTWVWSFPQFEHRILTINVQTYNIFYGICSVYLYLYNSITLSFCFSSQLSSLSKYWTFIKKKLKWSKLIFLSLVTEVQTVWREPFSNKDVTKLWYHDKFEVQGHRKST